MAITETRSLPAQFIEDLGKDYATQLTAATAVPVDTSKFAPTVAGQDVLQQRAASLAGSGIGAYQPFITAAQQQAATAGQTLGDVGTTLGTAGQTFGTAGQTLGGVTQRLGTASQTFGTAGQDLGNVGTTLSGISGLTGAPTSSQMQQYMSPYQSQVIDTTLSEFDRQRAIQEKAISDQAIASGAFGGGREGVQRAEYQSQSGRDRASLQAQLLQQGFGQAQQARQQDIATRFGLGQAQSGLAGQRLGLGQAQAGLGSQELGLGQAQAGLGQAQAGLAGQQSGLAGQQLGLGQFQAGLAGQVPQLQRADVSTLGQVGAAQQAQAQAELDAARQGARTAAYEPLERLGFFGQGVTGLMGGYPAQYNFQSTPPASPLQTALGLGTGLAGIFGALK